MKLKLIFSFVTLMIPFLNCKPRTAPSGNDAEIQWSFGAALRSEMSLATQAMEQKTGKKKNEIWAEGGRSWQPVDELNFAAWIDSVSIDILNEWKIPHDCADSIMALRWIYAVSNGLALRFEVRAGFSESVFDSFRYRADPVKLLVDAHNHIGADTLDYSTFEVDMSSRNNYKGGLIFSSGDHAFIMRGALRREGASPYYFQTLESTVPNTYRFLRESLFNVELPPKPYFRLLRFKSVVNKGGSVQFDASVSQSQFAPKRDISDIMIRECVNNESPLWYTLTQFIFAVDKNPNFSEQQRLADKGVFDARVRKCEFAKTLENDAPKPNLDAFFESSKIDLCGTIGLRSFYVGMGFNTCHKVKSKSCNAGPEGDHSTPHRDIAMAAKAKSFQKLSKLIGRTGDLKDLTCSVNLLDGINRNKLIAESAGELDSKQFDDLTKINMHPFENNEVAGWLKRLAAETKVSSDPTQSLVKRWACPEAERPFLCLK